VILAVGKAFDKKPTSIHVKTIKQKKKKANEKQ
jgi:hypothetical protein